MKREKERVSKLINKSSNLWFARKWDEKRKDRDDRKHLIDISITF
jgi:hypothetical protein